MADMSDKVKTSIENNRKVFSGMTLEQRTAQRQQLQDLLGLPKIFKIGMRLKPEDEFEARELIKIIDEMNEREIFARHGRTARQTPKGTRRP